MLAQILIPNWQNIVLLANALEHILGVICTTERSVESSVDLCYYSPQGKNINGANLEMNAAIIFCNAKKF